MLLHVKILKKYQPPVFTLSVGNLQVGGTGKTPHVEYLIKLFATKRIAVLSRGYGRKTKGFLKASENSSPETIGDEPFQIYNKLGSKVNVYVSENRPKGVLEIMKIDNVEVILLDDAYQHQYISPHLNLLLTTFYQPFSRDIMLPAGRLRESRANANRADAVIITKCPETLSDKIKSLLMNEVRKFAGGNKPVFFSQFEYKEPVCYGKNEFMSNQRFKAIASSHTRSEMDVEETGRRSEYFGMNVFNEERMLQYLTKEC